MGSRIPVEEVERFRREYVFGRDIAGLLRTSSRKMARVLAEQGIHPIREHTLEPPRMLFYLLTDELRRVMATCSGSSPQDLQLADRSGKLA